MYLKWNPQFLDNFVKSNIQREQITNWLELKVQNCQEQESLMGTICKLTAMMNEISIYYSYHHE